MGVKNMDCYKYGSLSRKGPNYTPMIIPTKVCNIIIHILFEVKVCLLLILFWAVLSSSPLLFVTLITIKLLEVT